MDFLKDDKKRENFINVISLTALGIFILLLTSGQSLEKLAYAIFIIFILSSYIIMPLNDSYKEGQLKEKSTILNLILRLIILIPLAISAYIIFIQKNYDLKYTYYVALVSFSLMLLEISYRSIRDSYNKREKKENGKYKNSKLIFEILYFTFIFVMFLSGTMGSIIASQREMDLKDIKIPISIKVNEMTEDYYDDIFNSNDTYKSETIDDPKEIEKIINELKDQKVESISATDKLNYERMTSDYDDQYILYFDYGEDIYGEDDYEEELYGNDGLKNGYIDDLIIASNRRIFIKNDRIKKGIIYRIKYYDEIYRIELSDDTIDMIRSYIK